MRYTAAYEPSYSEIPSWLRTNTVFRRRRNCLAFPYPSRRWDKQGVLVAVRTEGGHRRYPKDLIDQIANSGGSGDKIAQELATVKRSLAEKGRIIQLLVESEGRYRDLVETSHDLIWSTDAQGSFVYLNNAAHHVFGLAPKDLLGRCFFDFEVDSAHIGNRRFLALLKRHGEIKNHVTHLRTQNGEDRWIGINARVTINDRGEIAVSAAPRATSPRSSAPSGGLNIWRCTIR